MKDNTETEEIVIKRAKSGDIDSFETLFNLYHDRIYSLCVRIIGNPTEAQDICQEVFIQAMRKIETFKGKSSFSTWLTRIAINRSKDFLRSKKRKREVSSESILQGAGFDPQAPDKMVQTLETEAIVHDALLKLPESLRIPLILKEIEQLDLKEVSRILKLPEGTVKSRIFRAKLKLAELLEPHREHIP